MKSPVDIETLVGHLRHIAKSLFKTQPSQQYFLEEAAQTLEALALEAQTARAQLDALPADWRTDSSLETWFPFTAEKLARLERAAPELPAHEPTIAITELLSAIEPEERENVWGSIQAYADIHARATVQTLAARSGMEQTALAQARPAIAQMPVLSKALLDAIGEYGMARTDGLTPMEVEERWLNLIRQIKTYTAGVVSQQQRPTPEPDIGLSKSAINHMRRLVAWVRCEVGQEPADMQRTVIDVADKLNHPDINDEAKGRFVQSYQKAQSVPVYVRDAIRALEKLCASTSNRS